MPPEELDRSSGSESQMSFEEAETSPEIVESVEVQTEMEQSFLEYAMSVIVSRALPDVRDGLKPVHRRILWSMSESGHRPDRGHVKCATVVGDVIAKFHPHGDGAVYDALVRMGQDFSLRELLIDPHGNFGSPRDPPAAYRYTECRLSPLSMALLSDIHEETVDFLPNFDGRHREPEVLPCRFPNLLVNGSHGIAVGVATNIPTHNFAEVVDAVLHLLENPDADYDDLRRFVKGPDFPTGGQILGFRGIEDVYRTGRGAFTLRGRAEVVTTDGVTQIVVSEIPYQVSVEAIEERAAGLVEAKELSGVRDIRNESAKGVTRLVFDLTRDAQAMVVLNNLYKHTPLQRSFSANVVALDGGAPRTFTLEGLLRSYVDHQIEVVRRRSEFRLDRALQRAHILEGLLRAVDALDEIIALIRAAADRPTALAKLMEEPFEFSEVQATHILDLQLGRLTRLGRSDLEAELAAKEIEIAELEAVLADEALLRGVIHDELTALRDTFESPRSTEIIPDPGEFDLEDLIEDEDLVFIMTAEGYVKTVAADEFRRYRRGAKGIKGAELKEGDVVATVIFTSAHAYLLFFTNFGKVYRLRVHQIPKTGRTARGTAVVNLLRLEAGEKVAEVIDTRDYETHRYLMFVTAQGQIKKTLFKAYDSSLRSGLRAIRLLDGDELVSVVPFSDAGARPPHLGDAPSLMDVCLLTRFGQVLCFDSAEVRAMGRITKGVRGIRLRGGDSVVAMVCCDPQKMLLILTEAGFGKRTSFWEFRTRRRGGYGLKAIRLTETKGSVVAGLAVTDSEEDVVIAADDEEEDAFSGEALILMADNGATVRVPVADISIQSRYASGVKVMTLTEGQVVSAVTLVPSLPDPPADDAEEGEDSEGVGAAAVAAAGDDAADLSAGGVEIDFDALNQATE